MLGGGGGGGGKGGSNLRTASYRNDMKTHFYQNKYHPKTRKYVKSYTKNLSKYSINLISTVAPVLVATSIKQAPVLSKHFYVPPTDFTCK